MFSTRQPIRQTAVEAHIVRADGTVESLGVIAYWHANPLRRLAWRLSRFLRGRKPGHIRNL